MQDFVTIAPRKKNQPIKRVCACGCGQRIEPGRGRRRKYASLAHKQKAYRERRRVTRYGEMRA